MAPGRSGMVPGWCPGRLTGGWEGPWRIRRCPRLPSTDTALAPVMPLLACRAGGLYPPGSSIQRRSDARDAHRSSDDTPPGFHPALAPGPAASRVVTGTGLAGCIGSFPRMRWNRGRGQEGGRLRAPSCALSAAPPPSLQTVGPGGRAAAVLGGCPQSRAGRTAFFLSFSCGPPDLLRQLHRLHAFFPRLFWACICFFPSRTGPCKWNAIQTGLGIFFPSRTGALLRAA